MKAIKIHPSDKVAVAINTLKAQETFEIDGNEYVAKAEIPAGHKVGIMGHNPCLLLLFEDMKFITKSSMFFLATPRYS